MWTSVLSLFSPALDSKKYHKHTTEVSWWVGSRAREHGLNLVLSPRFPRGPPCSRFASGSVSLLDPVHLLRACVLDVGAYPEPGQQDGVSLHKQVETEA